MTKFEEDEPWYPDLWFPWVERKELDNPDLQVEVVEAEIINILYGPDGKELLYFYDKEIFTFGFCN